MELLGRLQSYQKKNREALNLDDETFFKRRKELREHAKKVVEIRKFNNAASRSKISYKIKKKKIKSLGGIVFFSRYLLLKLTKKMMFNGKFSKIYNKICKACLKFKLIFKVNIFIFLNHVLNKIKPVTETFKIKRRGKPRFYPKLLDSRRQIFIAVNWFCDGVRRNYLAYNIGFEDAFVKEVINILLNKGLAMSNNKKVLLELSNYKNLTHFRWKQRVKKKKKK